MKANGGMRGMYAAVAAAIMRMAPLPPAVNTVMGVGRKVPRCLRTYVRNNGGKGCPHQGARECARRRRQMGLGEFSGRYYTV